MGWVKDICGLPPNAAKWLWRFFGRLEHSADTKNDFEYQLYINEIVRGQRNELKEQYDAAATERDEAKAMLSNLQRYHNSTIEKHLAERESWMQDSIEAREKLIRSYEERIKQMIALRRHELFRYILNAAAARFPLTEEFIEQLWGKISNIDEAVFVGTMSSNEGNIKKATSDLVDAVIPTLLQFEARNRLPAPQD